MDINKLQAANKLIDLTKTDLLGRPKCVLFRGMKMPKPDHIIDYVVNGQRQGVTMQQVEAVLQVVCSVAETLCPLLPKN